MTDYLIRAATLDDVDALVHHRIAMFTDMGTPMDAGGLARSFRDWLLRALPAGHYLAWVIVERSGIVVGGGGILVLPWLPGPRDFGDRLPLVFNVYVEPSCRRLGLATRLMDTIHAWCREHEIQSIALAASEFGRPLYEAMGYRTSPNPFMFLSLEP